MKRIVLWPYKIGSNGARELQDKINELAPTEARCIRVRSDGNYRPHPNHLIVNWGNSIRPAWVGVNTGIIINKPISVIIAANKLHTFEDLNGMVATPPWTMSKEIASEEYIAQGKRVYCRTKLTGHSGEGIVVARTIGELVDAPLYTVDIDARAEYRVHIFRGVSEGGVRQYEVLDVQKKRRSTEALTEERVNTDIRNLAGGWVYARNNVEPPVAVLDNAKRAVEALGLDFGAVDIIEEKRTGNAYVLEVNTAPGLCGTTCENYAQALITLANTN